MARSIWSGAISFGLVSVPVKMYSATSSKELKFHFLHKVDDHLNPVGYDKVDKETGESVPSDEIVRGYEIEKGRFVEIDDEDFERLDIELTHSIDICDFVDIGEIDPVYFRSAYYLGPSEGAEKPYKLLFQALEQTGKVGIAKIVIRNKQHLACLRTYEGLLMIETMYYPDEVRAPDDVADVSKVKLRSAEVEMATTLVENLSEPFDPTKYTDTYRKELLDLIKAKAKGQELPEPQEAEEEPIDLMAALRESIERTQKSRSTRKTGSSARKSSSRTGTRKKASSRK